MGPKRRRNQAYSIHHEDPGRRWPSAWLEGGPHRNQIYQLFDFDLPASRTVRKKYLLFKPLLSMVFCFSSTCWLPHNVLIYVKRHNKEGHAIYLSPAVTIHCGIACWLLFLSFYLCFKLAIIIKYYFYIQKSIQQQFWKKTYPIGIIKQYMLLFQSLSARLILSPCLLGADTANVTWVFPHFKQR